MHIQKQVPMADFKREHEEIGREINNAVRRVLESGWYILGDEVKAFEHEFAHYVGVKYGVGVNSGTDALLLSLMALGLRRGDEVITVSHTFGSTALPVLFLGGKPVFVDVKPDTYNMDPRQIQAKITPKTKVIIPVHLYGNPADMDPINEIAEKHSIPILEDACQSHGATYKNRKTGSLGALAAFSFYPTKNLGCYGDGGMVLTDRRDLCETLLMLRQYGWKERDRSQIWGANSRLDEIQAGVLKVKLKHLEEWNTRRRSNARFYDELLKEVGKPQQQSRGRHVYHQYVITTKKRDQLQTYLSKHGVETGIHYHLPIHRQETFLKLGITAHLPVTESLYPRVISLPIHPWLREEDLEQVTTNITKFQNS